MAHVDSRKRYMCRLVERTSCPQPLYTTTQSKYLLPDLFGMLRIVHSKCSLSICLYANCVVDKKPEVDFLNFIYKLITDF